MIAQNATPQVHSYYRSNISIGLSSSFVRTLVKQLSESGVDGNGRWRGNGGTGGSSWVEVGLRIVRWTSFNTVFFLSHSFSFLSCVPICYASILSVHRSFFSFLMVSDIRFSLYFVIMNILHTWCSSKTQLADILLFLFLYFIFRSSLIRLMVVELRRLIMLQ